MPIIIDNFHVNTDLPIDSRFTVGGVDSFYQNKNDIEHKYSGLRIWDLNDNIPYYWNGTAWVNENSIGVSSDSSSAVNFLSKFTSGVTVIGKSLLYENPATNHIGLGISGGAILPNTTASGVVVSTALYGLHVAGNIRTSNYFIGNGLYITSLNATNVNSGLLDIRYISHLQSGSLSTTILPGSYILSNTAQVNGVSWVATSTISVGTASNANNVNIVSETTSTTNHYLTFVQSTGSVPVKINSTKIQFQPNNGQLFLSDGSVSQPVYSFLNSTNTGFYYNNSVDSTQNLFVGVAGNEIARFNSNGAMITKGRLYIPKAVSTTDAGYGIIFYDDTTINDGFVFNGLKINNYGIGSHIPTDISIPSGRGVYINGYFGVDLFSGGRLKIKVDEVNDVTINSILNTNNINSLFSSIGSNLVLATMKTAGGPGGNTVVVKEWAVRGTGGTDWVSWKYHNGITVDGQYNTPNGPTGLTGYSPASGSLTFWERFPYIREQYLGSEDKKTLTINSNINPFVKVDGSLLVGTSSVTPSAVADFNSNNKGIIPPRLTTTQRGTIITPVPGLTIYNTTTKHMEVYDGVNWVGLSTTKVTSGSLSILSRSDGLGDGWGNSAVNFNYVYPPTGYTMLDMVGFIASIERIDFGGNVNGDDFLWCRWAAESNRVKVWCNNSENDSDAIFQYMAIWQK